MNRIQFFHPCNPPKATAQQRRHCRNGASFLPSGSAKAAAFLFAICEQHKPEKPICGPISLILYWTWQMPEKLPGGGNPAKFTAFPKITRPDLDNLAKLALDAMTKCGYWLDDSQVVRLETAKWFGDLPGIAVTVDEVQP